MEQFNLVEFFRIIWKWRKHILIVCGVAVLGSIVISDPRIMPPYFESSSTLYPLNPNITSSGTLFSGTGDNIFGGSADIDRVLSVAASAPLKLYIVNKFKLFEHYDIDSANVKYPMYAVMNELDDNYKFEKNDKGAVVITVQDKDRFLAAQMANEVVNKIDQTNRELLNENKKRILTIYDTKMKEKEIEVRKLIDTIFSLKQQYDLYIDIADLPSQMSSLRKKGGAQYDAASERVKVLEEKKKGAIRELNNSIVQYEQYRASITAEVPTIFILEKAYPAEKKSKPVRWLIVVSTALIAFLICTVAVLLIDRYRAVKNVFRNVKHEVEV